MPRPASKTIARSTRGQKPEPRKPAKKVQDWKDEEAQEQDSSPVRAYVGGPISEPEDMVVGDNYKIINAGRPEWIKDGKRFYVSCWYPTRQAIIDYPMDEAERKEKQELFKGLKLPYLGILQNEPLELDAARETLAKQGFKYIKPAAAMPAAA